MKEHMSPFPPLKLSFKETEIGAVLGMALIRTAARVVARGPVRPLASVVVGPVRFDCILLFAVGNDKLC
jgi:hypothetical protein